jgi:hypothetical protein
MPIKIFSEKCAAPSHNIEILSNLRSNRTKYLPLRIPREEVSSELAQTKHVHFYHRLSDTGSRHI